MLQLFPFLRFFSENLGKEFRKCLIDISGNLVAYNLFFKEVLDQVTIVHFKLTFWTRGLSKQKITVLIYHGDFPFYQRKS